MKTLGRIATQEALLAFRSRTYRAVIVVITALLCASFLLEAVRHRDALESRRALQARVTDEWRSQPDRHPHRAAHYGYFVFRPPGALSFFDPGVESYAGAVTFLEPHQRNLSSFSEASQSSELTLFGSPSAAFVVQVLAPLLIFCMTFASVAGEREAGTWSLLLSQGVRVRTLLMGKVIGAWALALLCILPVLGLGFLLGWRIGALRINGDTLTRAVILLLGYAIYFGACAALGVLVSALHRRAQPALLSLIALWVALWLVIPRIATATATALHPGPSRAQLELDIARATRALGDSHDPNHPHFSALQAKTLQRYGVSRVEDLPINYAGVVMAEAERLSSRVFDRFHDQLDSAYRAQADWALRLGGFTPLLAIRSFSMALAGTDGLHLTDYGAKAEAYRYAFVQRLNELQTTRIHWREDKTQRLDRAEWQRLAPFEYQQPKAGWAAQHARSAWLSLVGWLSGLVLMIGLWTRTVGER